MNEQQRRNKIWARLDELQTQAHSHGGPGLEHVVDWIVKLQEALRDLHDEVRCLDRCPYTSDPDYGFE